MARGGQWEAGCEFHWANESWRVHSPGLSQLGPPHPRQLPPSPSNPKPPRRLGCLSWGPIAHSRPSSPAPPMRNHSSN
eukprot:4121749-Pyramimonas_sp.AAC.1